MRKTPLTCLARSALSSLGAAASSRGRLSPPVESSVSREIVPSSSIFRAVSLIKLESSVRSCACWSWVSMYRARFSTCLSRMSTAFSSSRRVTPLTPMAEAISMTMMTSMTISAAKMVTKMVCSFPFASSRIRSFMVSPFFHSSLCRLSPRTGAGHRRGSDTMPRNTHRS